MRIVLALPKLIPVTPDAERLRAVERVRLAGEIAVSYARVRWGLARRGLASTLADARRCQEDAPGARPAPSVATLLRMGRIVERTLGALPVDSRCLIRSLVLTRLLARRGVPCLLILAARSKPEFGAHSWVEYRGVALLPTGTAFHRLTEL